MSISTYLPAPLTAGHLCPNCKGTGADKDRTFAARKRGDCDSRAYIRCRACHGNGLDPAAYFRWSTPAAEVKVDVRRGNDLIFPKGNENGEYTEPLWLASIGSGRVFHGRTPEEAEALARNAA